MIKYAKIINEETKSCEVGLGTNLSFYQSIGMTEQEVEQSYDGSWYLKGYAPQKPIEISAIEIRSKRDQLLTASDWTQVSDSPLTQDQQSKWTEYRQYLRDIPQQEGFPNIEVKSFEEFQQDLE